MSHLEDEFNQTKQQLLDTVRREHTNPNANAGNRRDGSPPPPPPAATAAHEAPEPESPQQQQQQQQQKERLLTPSKYRQTNRKELGVQAGARASTLESLSLSL